MVDLMTVELDSIERELLSALVEVDRSLDQISIHSPEYDALSKRSLELNQHLGAHLVASARIAYQECGL